MAINPLMILPTESETMAERVNSINRKYSDGPNFKAKLAKGFAKKTKPMVAKTPPIKEATAEIAIAWPACPFLDMGYPSKVAAIADPSPGVFNKMELLDPPYIAP